MDFNEAITDLKRRFPDVDSDLLRKALDAEEKDEIERLSGRGKYEKAIETAHLRITEWITDGYEYAVVLDYADMAKFAASHRTACVICVMISKARNLQRSTQVK